MVFYNSNNTLEKYMHVLCPVSRFLPVTKASEPLCGPSLGKKREKNVIRGFFRDISPPIVEMAR